MFQGLIMFSALAASVSSGFLFGPSYSGNYSLLCDHTKEYRCLCPADDTASIINCASRRIVELPNGIDFPDHITDAVFKDNQLTNVPSTLFVKGVKVQHIDLSHNKINFLAADAFANLENLELIDLSHNAIWSLALGTFRGPRYLSKLNLDYNRINSFFDDLFKDCSSVKELTMRYNSIMSFDSDSFSYLTSLEKLDISNAGLSLLPENLFVNNTKLAYLQLSANSFGALPSKAIKSAANLKQLDISENPLDTIHPNAFYGLEKLEFLKITHMRKLTSLSAHSLAGLDSLKELHLSDNLMLNKISGLSFKKMPPVTTESTEKSASEDEEDENTNKHPALEKISLRHNSLHWLPEELVDWSQLKELDLSENPWNCDCHLSWMAPNTISESVKKTAKCSAPPRLSGKALSSLVESDYTCSYMTSEATVALAALVVVAFLAALVGVAFVLYRRSQVCRQKSQEPKYTRVVSTKERVDLEWDHTAEPDSTA